MLSRGRVLSCPSRARHFPVHAFLRVSCACLLRDCCGSGLCFQLEGALLLWPLIVVAVLCPGACVHPPTWLDSYP